MPPTLISDFTGTDENPLSEGGNWTNLNTSANPLQRISNAVAAPATAQSRSYWTPANFGPDLEAYVTISTVATTTIGIDFRVQGEGGAGTWDGYEVRVLGNLPDTNIYRFDNGVQTGVEATFAAPSNWATGDKLGIRCVGSGIQAWRLANGATVWVMIAAGVDATYASAGKIGLEAGNATVRVDDFYAGPMEYFFGGNPQQVPAVPFM